MTYGAEFQKFIEPARTKSALWRLVVGILVLGIVYIVVAVGIVLAGFFLLGIDDPRWLMSTEAMGQPGPMLWLLSTFIGMALAAVVAARLLHGRKAATLMGRGARVTGDFLRTAAVFFAIGVPPIVAWIIFGDLAPNLETSRWLMLLPAAVVLIGIQTLAEELVFRGYLLQQLGARFKSAIVWMVLPSLAFGALHYNPALDTQTLIGVIAITSLFGLVAADLTARTGSLGSAWGFHFANNFMAMALLSVDNSLSGLALWRAPLDLVEQGIPPGLLIGDAVMIILGWFLTRRMLRR